MDCMCDFNCFSLLRIEEELHMEENIFSKFFLTFGKVALHIRVSSDTIDPDLVCNCEYAGGKDSNDIDDLTGCLLLVCGN